MSIHLPKFFGLFEAIGATVRRVLAFEIEVTASLARGIAIALDLSAFAFVAKELSVSKSTERDRDGDAAPFNFGELAKSSGNEVGHSDVPSNRNVSVSLRSRMCGSVGTRIVSFSLLSALIPGVRGTLRTG
jgi:hypothetical protein